MSVIRYHAPDGSRLISAPGSTGHARRTPDPAYLARCRRLIALMKTAQALCPRPEDGFAIWTDDYREPRRYSWAPRGESVPEMVLLFAMRRVLVTENDGSSRLAWVEYRLDREQLGQTEVDAS